MAVSVQYDPEADAISIRLRDEPYAFGEDIDSDRRIDYAADRLPIGVELLNVSLGVDIRNLPDQAAIERVLQEHNIKAGHPGPPRPPAGRYRACAARTQYQGLCLTNVGDHTALPRSSLPVDS